MTILWIIFCIAISSWNANAIEVSTTLGAIRGAVLRSRLGKDFNAFRGIRYGKSPVGDLRFKNPQPAEAWKPNTFDGTEDGPQCPQEPFNSTDNSEDCLRLNVYTINLSPNILKPVVVYFHTGAHSKSFAGPEFLMDRDIVLVTIGYRLGALGFLATGTPDAPGNAGLKDQVLALRWINQHIQNFGGDPNSVTLLAAGSVSVGFHMMSPMSKGLFHRGIAMSASPIPLEKYPENQMDLVKKQAELVNCPTTNFNDMMQCLRKTPAEEFERTYLDLNNLGFYMLQVIEEDHGQERFLVEDPTEAFQEGRFQRTPLIVGMTNDEFVRIAKLMLQDKNLTNKLNEDWETQAPIILKYERNTPKSKYVSTVLRREYLQNQTLGSDIPFEPFGKLFSDAIIGFPVHRFAHLAARYVPVYYYRYSYKGRFSDFLYPGDNTYIPPVHKKTDPEEKTVERLTRIVSQFAETGNPNNPEGEYLKAVDWTPLDLAKENFLDIGEELVMNEGLFLERFDIWERLYPLKWKGPEYDDQSLDNLKLPCLARFRRRDKSRRRNIWGLEDVYDNVANLASSISRGGRRKSRKSKRRRRKRRRRRWRPKKRSWRRKYKSAKYINTHYHPETHITNFVQPYKEEREEEQESEEEEEVPPNKVEGNKTEKEVPLKKVEDSKTEKEVPLRKVEGNKTEKVVPLKKVEDSKTEKEVPLRKVEGNKTAKEVPLKKVDDDKTEKKVPLKKVEDNKLEKEVPLKKVEGNKTEKEVPSKKVEGNKTEKAVPLRKVEGKKTEKDVPFKKVEDNKTEKEVPLKKVEDNKTEKEVPLRKVEGNKTEKEVSLKKVEGNQTEKEVPLKKVEGNKTEKEVPLKKVEGNKTEKEVPLKKVEGNKTEKEVPLKKVEDNKTEKEVPLKKVEDNKTEKEVPLKKVEDNKTEKEVPLRKVEGNKTEKDVPLKKVEDNKTEKEVPLKKVEENKTEKEVPLKKLEGNKTEKEVPLKKVEGNKTEKEVQLRKVEDNKTEKEVPLKKVEGNKTEKQVPLNKAEGNKTEKEVPSNKVEGNKTEEEVPSNEVEGNETDKEVQLDKVEDKKSEEP